MTTEDLENYEADRELQLAQEYRDVTKMFRFAVETERRFYLANEVEVKVVDSQRPMVELELRDAWVWDMYRKSRFVSSVRVVEGSRERVQVFQGNVTAIQGSGVSETFTVRKLSFGVGVERTFPMHSPIIAKLEVLTRGDVRRAKLYYLRERTGKRAKVKEKRER